MSKLHSVEVHLEATPTQPSLSLIIMNAFRLGCTFSVDIAKNPVLTPEEVVKKLLLDFQNPDPLYLSYARGVEIVYEGSILTLFAYSNQNRLQLTFLASQYVWYRSYKSSEYVNLEKYIKFILQLCNPLPLKKLETLMDD